MKPFLPAILAVSGMAFQTSPPKVPVAATPEDAPLPAKTSPKSRGISSELESVNSTEDGVMSFAKYEGGSVPFKQNKITTYVNEKEIVLVQSKQRFAIPVKSVTEVLYGNAVNSRVGLATGINVLTAGTKNQSAGSLTLVGIIWPAATNKNGVVLRIDKADFPGFITALQTVTGLKGIDTGVKGR
jgi:hypothetical protein